MANQGKGPQLLWITFLFYTCEFTVLYS